MNSICNVCNKQILHRHHLAKLCFDCSNGDYGLGRSRAHAAVSKALKSGQLRYANEFGCVDCGNLAECYDHRDYNKPLEVEPVCRKCNFRRGLAIPLDMTTAKPKRKPNKQKPEEPKFLFTSLQ